MGFACNGTGVHLLTCYDDLHRLTESRRSINGDEFNYPHPLYVPNEEVVSNPRAKTANVVFEADEFLARIEKKLKLLQDP